MCSGVGGARCSRRKNSFPASRTTQYWPCLLFPGVTGPKTKEISLKQSPVTCSSTGRMNQQIKDRLKSYHTFTFKMLFNKEFRKGNRAQKGG